MPSARRIYLDHSATTPADPRVVEAMMPYLTSGLATLPASTSLARKRVAAVDRARREVAGLIGARSNEIVFLSGGTEANNLAIRGLCEASNRRDAISSLPQLNILPFAGSAML